MGSSTSFHYPDNPIVGHKRMRALVLPDNLFVNARDHLIETFGPRATMIFHDAARLDGWFDNVEWAEPVKTIESAIR